MTVVLLLAALSGAPVDSQPALILKVHLGRDSRSRIARHELECTHPYWLGQRFAIQQHYRLVWDDDECSHPSYQIGRSDRQLFPAASFAASGSFIRTLRSIADVDAWERSDPKSRWVKLDTKDEWGNDDYGMEDDKPEVFPPVTP